MKRVLMMSTVASTIAAFNIPNIKILKSLGYEVDVAANFNDNMHYPSEKTIKFIEQLDSMGVRHFQIACSRNITNFKSIFCAIKEIINLMKENRYEFVHCHTPVASVIARIAAHKTGTKVIYTAHGFHFMNGAPLKNWLIFFPIEKFFSRYTDILITINKEDYSRAKKFHAKKVVYVPGVGIDVSKFSTNLISDQNKIEIRHSIGIPDNSTFLLSVGELNQNKNHEIVIRAIGKLKQVNPDMCKKIYYAIAGTGNTKDKLKLLAKKLDVSENLKLLGYRNDVSKLYKAADFFIMPSFREGLSVALMEAMATGLPCIVSRIRGNVDLIDKNGGSLFNSHSINDCYNSIFELCNKSEDQRKIMGTYNRNKIEDFNIEVVSKIMKEIYKGV